MVEKDLSVAIFGDCATHISCKEYRHTRAVGLSNWVSIVSPSIDEFTRLTEESLRELPMANYEKRICLLNANKQFINYLLGEKADYLIIDCNDCRKGVIYDNSGEHNALACITSNPHMAGFSQVLETIFGDKGKYRYVSGIDIERSMYDEAAEVICEAIKKVYPPDRVILLKHYYATGYIDDKGFHEYTRYSVEENDKTVEVIKYVESLVEKQLEGCHVIDFPESVLGDAKHWLGNCSLHYHSMYYDYAREALKIIIEQHTEEKLLLEQLRCNYSMRFRMLKMELLSEYKDRLLGQRVDSLVEMLSRTQPCCTNTDISDLLSAQDDIDAYLDILYILRDKIVVLLATKDSCGFYAQGDTLKRLKRLGFKRFPAKFWWMYAGIIARGKVLVDSCGVAVENPVILEQCIGENVYSIKSMAFRRGNLASIQVNRREWSLDCRGINIVVCNPENGEVLDSISYDSHIMDYFYRKPIEKEQVK